MIEGKSQKAILTTLQDKYEKKLIKKAVQSSPVTIMNNTQIASIFMFFSTLIGILIGPFILDSDIVKFQTFEWVMISIMALFFSVPYFGAFILMHFIKNLSIKFAAVLLITIYHTGLILFNIVIGITTKSGFGVGIIPLFLTLQFVSMLVSWKKYKNLFVDQT